MITLCSPTQASLPTVLALGSFDGLHAGHRKVIQSISQDARGIPTVVSFWPHPREVLYGETKLKLDLPSEKKLLLEPLGINQLVLIPFNKELSIMNAETFINNILIETLQAKHIAVGENFRFGRKREGDVTTLQKVCSPAGIDVSIIPILKDSIGRISSSRIREALAEGDLQGAQNLLGRKYSFRGTVKTGKGLGSKIGWPTANLNIDGRKFLPALGVYAAWTYLPNNQSRHASVMNLGPQPTIDPSAPSAIEVHLLDKSINLLGEELIIEPVQRLRIQKKFQDLQSLSHQIKVDAKFAREILNES